MSQSNETPQEVLLKVKKIKHLPKEVLVEKKRLLENC